MNPITRTIRGARLSLPAGGGLVYQLIPRQFIDPQSLGGMPLEPPSWMGWAGTMLLPVVLLTLAALLLWRRAARPSRVTEPGFEVIAPTEQRRFFPIAEKHRQLDFVAAVETDSPLRLSANLNRVSLSIRRFGYLLEDKNYRNALLINRRRMRRTLLRDGDVLDLGDLTLLYRDPRAASAPRSATRPSASHVVIKFKRVRGPVRKGTPFLVSEQYPNRTFYLTKNMVYIGRSEENDLVVKAPAIHYRHAKIEKVGGRYKLQDIGMTGNTYVNNRRVEQRFLKEGDLISFDKERFKFQIAPQVIRDRDGDGQNEPAYSLPEDETEAAYTEEAPAV